MSVKQISMFLEHQLGKLYDMTMTLADNDINIISNVPGGLNRVLEILHDAQ